VIIFGLMQFGKDSTYCRLAESDVNFMFDWHIDFQKRNPAIK